MILCEPLCLGVFVAGKVLLEWTQVRIFLQEQFTPFFKTPAV